MAHPPQPTQADSRGTSSLVRRDHEDGSTRLKWGRPIQRRDAATTRTLRYRLPVLRLMLSLSCLNFWYQAHHRQACEIQLKRRLLPTRHSGDSGPCCRMLRQHSFRFYRPARADFFQTRSSGDRCR